MMKLRLAAPANLIDLAKVEGLNGIEVNARSLTVGAMTTHHEMNTSPVVQETMPALSELAGLIGDPAVRYRGTIGGSLAHNDPTADYPAACLALDASIITTKRRIAAADFFTGLFETALERDEIITKVSFPLAKRAAYQKFRNPASRYAMVGVFVAKRPSDVGVAVTGAGTAGAFRLPEFEEALKKRFSPKSLEGLAVPSDDLTSDLHASAPYRAHLIGVLARRAVAAALARGE
jgi:carbon-monoxide dehydrogenase medium subunit